MKKNRNRVRLIAGRLRGRSISFADSPGLRPTGDRLRETLFSWLQPNIVESRVLDMFAGSGSLGFEAASRGALKVTLVEKSRTVCAELRRNAQQLDLDNVCIKCMDALHLESAENEAGCFDVVFLDPPFADGLYQAAIDVLCRGSLLADGARVIIEGNRRTEPAQVPAQWQLEKDKTAGEVRLQLFIVQRPFAAN